MTNTVKGKIFELSSWNSNSLVGGIQLVKMNWNSFCNKEPNLISNYRFAAKEDGIYWNKHEFNIWASFHVMSVSVIFHGRTKANSASLDGRSIFSKTVTLFVALSASFWEREGKDATVKPDSIKMEKKQPKTFPKIRRKGLTHPVKRRWIAYLTEAKCPHLPLALFITTTTLLLSLETQKLTGQKLNLNKK